MRVEIDENNYSIARIEEKCVYCGMCLSTCNELNNIEGCINCGACINTCPTGALVIKMDYDKVLKELNDSEKVVVVSTSPGVRVAIGDAFGYEYGTFLEGKLVASLKALGFKYVFDTTFGADLTIMEEASELIERIKRNDRRPMFTSCCPSWITYMEQELKEDLEHISTCKSPIGMQASIIKEYFSKKMGIKKDNIVSVFLAPCVSKKSEIKRKDELNADYVITTKELELMIREAHINFDELEDEPYDKLLGKGSGAGLIFASSGGVMEAALRTAYYLINGKNAPKEFYTLSEVRGYKPFKEAEVDLESLTLRVAVINGISNVKKYYSLLKEYDFIEVMSCPGGCIGGAGQQVKLAEKEEAIEKRMDSIYRSDKISTIRNSHENEEVKELYKEFLTKEKAHELLHTSYNVKEKINN